MSKMRVPLKAVLVFVAALAAEVLTVKGTTPMFNPVEAPTAQPAAFSEPVCEIPLPDPLPSCGSTGNSLAASVSGGTPPYTFVWTVGGSGVLTGGQGTNTITFDFAGGDIIIGLTVTDSNGRTALCSRTFACVPRQEFCSLTQGFYGNSGGRFNGQSTLALIRSLLATDLVVGRPGRSLKIQQAAAQCIIDRLPASGPPSVFPGLGDNTLDPNTCQTSPTLPLDKDGDFRNILLGQTVVLALNGRLDAGLGNLAICNIMVTGLAAAGPDGLLGTADDLMDAGPDGIFGTSDDTLTVSIPVSVTGALSALGLPQTVNGLLELAGRALAGEATGGASLGDINNAVNAINTGFNRCRFLKGCSNTAG